MFTCQSGTFQVLLDSTITYFTCNKDCSLPILIYGYVITYGKCYLYRLLKHLYGFVITFTVDFWQPNSDICCDLKATMALCTLYVSG